MSTNKYRIHIDLMLARILILFPVTSSVGKLLPLSLNQVMVLFLVVLIVIKQLENGKIQKRNLNILLYTSFFVINGLILTTEMSLNLENCIYWVTTIIVLSYIGYKNNREALFLSFKKSQKLIAYSSLLTILINVFGMFSSQNYEDTGAYRGYMVTSHSMASTMVLGISILLLYKKNFFHVVSIAAEVFILFTAQARTFMIPLSVLLYFELRQWITSPTKRRCIIGCVVMITFIVFPSTSMADKFIETLNNPYARDWLSGITNFRSTLWEGDIFRFVNENWYLKFFGNGFSYTYQLHERMYGVKIWSHNDFFNLLIATGVVGLAGYLYILLDTINRLQKEHKTPFYSLLLIFMVFGTAFFNGFYLYTAVVFSFVVLVIGENIAKREI